MIRGVLIIQYGTQHYQFQILSSISIERADCV